MDGSAASAAEWDMSAGLVINADQIGATAANHFGGVIDVGGGAFSTLTVNLADPLDSWQMGGEMNLSGISGLYFTRVAGSRMVVTGDLNVSDANINIAADVTVTDAGAVNFAAPGSDLRLSGLATIGSNATFTGQGLLHNNGDGMTLADGASLGQAGLVNGGQLHFGVEVPGQAFVDRFTNEADGTFHAEIGGTTPGTELTQFFVTGGTAQLGGALALTLVNDGGGLFAPELGDEFTILTAAGGVVGEFDYARATARPADGLLFEVQYTRQQRRAVRRQHLRGRLRPRRRRRRQRPDRTGRLRSTGITAATPTTTAIPTAPTSWSGSGSSAWGCPWPWSARFPSPGRCRSQFSPWPHSRGVADDSGSAHVGSSAGAIVHWGNCYVPRRVGGASASSRLSPP